MIYDLGIHILGMYNIWCSQLSEFDSRFIIVGL